MSTNPGMTVLPETSISRALPGMSTVPLAPTPTIRLSRITMSPFSMISFPFMVTMRAPRSATTPSGLSFTAVIR